MVMTRRDPTPWYISQSSHLTAYANFITLSFDDYRTARYVDGLRDGEYQMTVHEKIQDTLWKQYNAWIVLEPNIIDFVTSEFMPEPVKALGSYNRIYFSTEESMLEFVLTWS